MIRKDLLTLQDDLRPGKLDSRATSPKTICTTIGHFQYVLGNDIPSLLYAEKPVIDLAFAHISRR